MRRRSRARRIALEVLYMADVRREAGRDIARDYLPDKLSDPEMLLFARELVEGASGRLEEIDAQIRAAARNWDIERMAALDRNILRLAIYEMAWRDDIPPKVSINEAIELAKKFGTEESGQFVNGILDKIKDTLEATGPLQAGPADAPAASDAEPREDETGV